MGEARGQLLSLAAPVGRALGAAVGGRIAPALERALGLDRINAVYGRCIARPLPEGAGRAGGAGEFVRRVLADMGVRYDVSPEDLARIPKRGPVVVVANHPFGGLDGLILAAVVAEARDDVRVMANHLLGRVPEVRDLFVLVDPFGGPAAAAANVGPIRQSLRWLKDGHLLAAFPAGEVAHLSLATLRASDRWAGEPAVTDPAWHPTVAGLARRAGATIVPVYFEGQNDALFQAAGLVHPRLRTALLPRAFLGRQGERVTLRVGSVVPAKRAAAFETDAALTDYLRRRTFLLRHGAPRPSIPAAPAADVNGAATNPAPAPIATPSSSSAPAAGMRAAVERVRQLARMPGKRPAAPAPAEPVAPAVPADLLEADLAALPPDALLLAHDDMAVYAARAPQLRNVLREIGRLRELTFRQVGEGTGRAVDLDTFDYDYTHLFIWDRSNRRIVGAYRLGQTDALLPAKGRQGLYTSTLFNYKAGLLRRLDPALEMGRSFVRPECQKSYAPLLLLWKGIGHYLVRHPRYRYLFGPVSISNSYQTVSRQLMVEFLRLNHAMPEGESLATPRNPFNPRTAFGARAAFGASGRRALRLGSGNWDDVGLRRLLADDDEVSDLIADLEPDHKGIPVLVRQYLKLGAKFVAFNVDRAFGDCLDGLIVVDLLHTEPRVLERYMTKPGYADFVAHLKGRAAVGAGA